MEQHNVADQSERRKIDQGLLVYKLNWGTKDYIIVEDGKAQKDTLIAQSNMFIPELAVRSLGVSNNNVWHQLTTGEA